MVGGMDHQTENKLVTVLPLYHPKFRLALSDLSRFEYFTQTRNGSTNTYKYIIYIYIKVWFERLSRGGYT